MIHPINIPEDLLEPNPRIPSALFAEKPKKLRISYTKDGRRVNADGGAPLNAISPNTEWRNFFLRSFVRRLACEDAVGDSHADLSGSDAPTSSASPGQPPHIDIVDLQPNGYCSANGEAILAQKQSGPGVRDSLRQGQDQGAAVLASGPGTRDHLSPNRASLWSNGKDHTRPLGPEYLRPDRASVSGEDSSASSSSDDEDEEGAPAAAAKRALLAFGHSARLPLTRQISTRVGRQTLASLIAPCCAESHSHSRIGGRFKEFARFDFSHSNFFADKPRRRATDCATEQPAHSRDQDPEEEEARRKCSIEMVPNTVGSRLWTASHPGTPAGRERLSRCHSTPPPSDLIFSVRSVAARRRSLEITMGIRNSTPRPLTLYVTVHVHEVANDRIGRLASISCDTIQLKAKEELNRIFRLDIYAVLKPIFSDARKYPLVTLHGRVADAGC